jgi:hypothetical protein
VATRAGRRKRATSQCAVLLAALRPFAERRIHCREP